MINYLIYKNTQLLFFFLLFLYIKIYLLRFEGVNSITGE